MYEIIRSEHNVLTDKQEITAVLDSEADLTSLSAATYSVGSIAIIPDSQTAVYMLKPAGWTEL